MSCVNTALYFLNWKFSWIDNILTPLWDPSGMAVFPAHTDIRILALSQKVGK